MDTTNKNLGGYQGTGQTGTFGGMIYNGATPQNPYGSVTVPTTLQSNQITSNPQPFQVPQTNPNTASNSLTSAITSLAPQLAQAQNSTNTAESQNNQGQNDLVNLMSQLGGQTTDTQSAENQVGLPTLNNDLTDLKTLQSQQLAGYISNINQNQLGKDGAVTRFQQDGNANQITRQHGIDALLTSSLIQAKEGNIQSAQATVDRAIAAKYDPIKNAINVQQQIIANNKDNLSRADKKLAEVQTQKNALELKKIDQAVDNEKLTQQMFIDAASMQAPNSVIQSAKNILDKGGTPAQVAQALGQFTGAAAKAQLLQEQIKTEQAQRSKIYNDIKSSGNNGILDIKEAQALGVPYGTTKAQAMASAQGQIGKPIPLNEVQKNALTSAEALLDSLNTLGGKAPVGFNSILGTVPGTSYRDFSVNFDNLKSLLSLDNVKLLKGQGSVSDAERQLLSDASAKLNRSQSQPEFKKALTDIITTFQKASPEYQYVDSVVNSIQTSGSLSPENYANSFK